MLDIKVVYCVTKGSDMWIQLFWVNLFLNIMTDRLCAISVLWLVTFFRLEWKTLYSRGHNLCLSKKKNCYLLGCPYLTWQQVSLHTLLQGKNHPQTCLPHLGFPNECLHLLVIGTFLLPFQTSQTANCDFRETSQTLDNLFIYLCWFFFAVILSLPWCSWKYW